MVLLGTKGRGCGIAGVRRDEGVVFLGYEGTRVWYSWGTKGRGCGIAGVRRDEGVVFLGYEGTRVWTRRDEGVPVTRWYEGTRV